MTHRRSLEIGERIGYVIVRHSAHCNIGFAHLTLGEPEAALPHFEESLRILGGHGHWQRVADAARAGAGAAGTGATPAGPRRSAKLLLCLAIRRGNRYTEGLARHQRGLLNRADGDIEEARRQSESAFSAMKGTDSPVAGELRDLLARG
ncbi:hypothetical protein ACWGQ5_43175 [Streptomyces sp. NPDC055722]